MLLRISYAAVVYCSVGLVFVTGCCSRPASDTGRPDWQSDSRHPVDREDTGMSYGLAAGSVETVKIDRLQVGSCGWTVPWAMWADKSGKLWLNGSYQLSSGPGGTVCMLVARDSTGYRVQLPRSDNANTYDRAEPFYVGDFTPQPVVQLAFGGGKLARCTEDGQALLPDALLSPSIGRMPVGTSGWTVPWGMYADEQGRVFLHDGYLISKTRGGTACMLVTRTAGGYTVNLSACPGERWRKAPPCYVGAFTPLPVKDLETAGGLTVEKAADGQALLPADLAD